MSTVSSVISAGDIQTDYMKLLVTELQCQDPLEPLDNKEMASQLAQLSQLQQLETMNSNFSEVLSFAEKSYANSLTGKEICYSVVGENGEKELASGTVEQVYNDVNGKVLLGLGNQTVKLSDVLSVG